MTTLEKLRKAIIMAIHQDCNTYDEAIMVEKMLCSSKGDRIFPLTLARVLQAISNLSEFAYIAITSGYFVCIKEYGSSGDGIQWKLLNEDGSDCTLEQQNYETQKSLLKLLTQ